MKNVVGMLMVVAGIILGAYVGFWICFVGGIVDVIAEIRAENLVAMNIALGIAKVFFAGAAGWLSALLLIVPGAALLKN